MVLRMFVEKNILITERTEWLPSICIGYYTVDYTIPNYIWTSAYRLVQIYFGIVQLTVKLRCYYISNCLKKMPLLHIVLIVVPCKQQNVTYIRFLKHMHLPLKRTSSYKNTHTVNKYTD